jgi:hypothetical protein
VFSKRDGCSPYGLLVCVSPRVLVVPLQRVNDARSGETGHFTFCRLLSCVDVPTAPTYEYQRF